MHLAHFQSSSFFLLNTENSCVENWSSLYTSCQLQSILKVIIITSAMHVVHIQLEIRRQFINEGSLFVTASVALQGCRSQRACGPAREHGAQPVRQLEPLLPRGKREGGWESAGQE